MRASLPAGAIVASIVLAVMTATATSAPAPAPAVTTAPDVGGKRIIGYFAGWSNRYRVEDIPADKLTHVNYAFAVIRDDRCVMKDPAGAAKHFADLRALKQKHPHLRTLISVGGWTDSTGFYDTAKTAASRETFARSAAAFAGANGFDGVDIDWEYPGGGGNDKGKGGPEDTKNFTALLQDLRRALDEQGKTDGKHYLLTIAAPAGGQVKRIDLAAIAPLLDFINLMTYDFAGEWSKTTAFNAPLHPAGDGQPQAADTAVRAYLAAGTPPEKLVLGVPFYGRAWGGVKDVNHGLFQPHTAKPPRAPSAAKDDGGAGFAWRTLDRHYLDKGPTRYFHEQAKVPWLFDPRTGLFVTYDDPESLRLKAEYARDQKLGGVMIWELSHDDGGHSLLDALHSGLQR